MKTLERVAGVIQAEYPDKNIQRIDDNALAWDVSSDNRKMHVIVRCVDGGAYVTGILRIEDINENYDRWESDYGREVENGLVTITNHKVWDMSGSDEDVFASIFCEMNTIWKMTCPEELKIPWDMDNFEQVVLRSIFGDAELFE